MDEQLDKQVERNLRGIELKKAGKVEEAIELYEQNIKENLQVVTHMMHWLLFTENKRGLMMRYGCWKKQYQFLTSFMMQGLISLQPYISPPTTTEEVQGQVRKSKDFEAKEQVKTEII